MKRGALNVSNPSTRPHAGWSEAENERLFALAAEAAANGRPLKSVFDDFAASSGRRPNSVRNYYYARVKEGGVAFSHTPAFVPFTEAEAVALLENVLSAQARGESVRSCTLRLGNGDDRAMLRYQNKYRSLVRTNPALVKSVVERLTHSGAPCADPYAPRPNVRRVGRPKKGRLPAGSAEAVLRDLSRVRGLNVSALFDALGTLAVAAVSGERTAQPPDGELESLRRALADADDRYRTLLSYFRQLVRVNTEFLRMNSVVKVSDLSGYIHDLEANVETCRRLMPDNISS